MNEPTVALYKGKGIISSLIKWQSDGVYSHAAIWLPDGNVIESWAPGGVRRDPTPWTAHNDTTDIDRFRVTIPVDWEKALAFLHGEIGQPYDYLAIARFMTRLRGASDKAWFCSELVYMALLVGGAEILRRTQAWQVSPSKLALSPFLEKIESHTP